MGFFREHTVFDKKKGPNDSSHTHTHTHTHKHVLYAYGDILCLKLSDIGGT